MKYLIAVLVFLALSGWSMFFVQVGYIQFGIGDLKLEPLEPIKVYRWNQLTQEKGKEAK